jgi:hypothetical protein
MKTTIKTFAFLLFLLFFARVSTALLAPMTQGDEEVKTFVESFLEMIDIIY